MSSLKNAFVRTVLGDVHPKELGAINYHEHLFQASPLLPGDELDDEARSHAEARLLVAGGTTCVVEATPTNLGRNVQATARISEALGLHIVHATGAHHQAHYRDGDPLLSASASKLGRLFTDDVEKGFAEGDGIGDATMRQSSPAGLERNRPRAGVLKAGIRYWAIGDFERRVIEAVSEAHRASGAPVMIHLDFGSAAHEVLDLLMSHGVPAESVVLAHIDRNLDAGLHVSLAERGAYLGYDGMARHREAPDSAILTCLEEVMSWPLAATRVLLGGDVARASRYRAYGGLPGIDYLSTRFLPRVLNRVGSELTNAMTITNPSRWLTFTPLISDGAGGLRDANPA